MSSVLARAPAGGFGRSTLGGNLVLRGRALQLLELQLHLVEDPRRAFRERAIELASELLDLQVLMRDQGFIIRGLGSGPCQLGFNPRRPGGFGDALEALVSQRRLQRVDVIGDLRRIQRHQQQTITA